ncbi:hypothetical protein FEDK69T_18460 [Flavobacterium enshiense DK69]|uniref:Lipocalin-like domain-containing protein n=1 Tax=Flavobacterium enshiense DK69 TaxID=1107311 RepID=V6S7B0_9FLAO|nr:lipocalin family protein [Flavobacterium enshiense]ESU22593.1 hypothetical protein FEDK69T_18460 [Flavobacterium enshiense DK69]KGO95695.1 hypothetical protein Q767_10795 [Flavobacterium enshiense DK69]
MKKINILFVSALTLGLSFASCNNDDNGGSSSSTPSLEGKWIIAKQGMVMDGQESLTNHQNECSTKKDFMELKSGGIIKDVYYPEDCTADITNGSWSKNGNNVTISFEGEDPFTAQIVTLNETNLKVKFIDAETQMTLVAVFNRG